MALPLKDEQAEFLETNPAPLDLQPIKKAARSSWVMAVVLWVQILTKQEAGTVGDAPGADQQAMPLPENDWHGFGRPMIDVQGEAIAMQAGIEVLVMMRPAK